MSSKGPVLEKPPTPGRRWNNFEEKSGMSRCSDIALPVKRGLDLLKEVKAELPRIPVLVLSADEEDQFAVRVLKAGAGGYMTKESAPGELAKAIRKILAGGRYLSPALE